MPTLSGRAVKKCQISTDGTDANLKELKTDLIQTINLNRGRASTERTRGHQSTQHHQRVKGNPSITLNFDPDSSGDLSLMVAFLGADVPRSFNIELSDGTANGGYRVAGVALINDGNGLEQNVSDGMTGGSITLVQDVENAEWGWTNTTT